MSLTMQGNLILACTDTYTCLKIFTSTIRDTSQKTHPVIDTDIDNANSPILAVLHISIGVGSTKITGIGCFTKAWV